MTAVDFAAADLGEAEFAEAPRARRRYQDASAIEAFRQPKVVILGGSDKGATYDELAKAVAQNDVRAALLIGEQAEKIKTALNAVGFSACTNGGTTMSEIVANAKAAARSGDAVLLSTGCASFGLFKDYKDRGDQFKSAVMTLN